MKSIHHAQPSLYGKSIVLLTGSLRVWAVVASLAPLAFALDGQVRIHDPSTIVRCDGRFYTYGTGGTTLVSDDGWTWRRGVTPSRRGMAPDIIQLGDRYYQYISSNPGGQPHSQIFMISSKSLNPESPDYEWEDGGIVNSTDGVEFCNGIDPGLFLDPTDGKLWMT
ncbi:MAG: family 43 glycosylhydrolase, partial [Phycisphaerales bacterium]